MGLGNLRKKWPLIIMWALALGILASLWADWRHWDRLPLNLLWRVLIVAIGGVLGLVLDYFASIYIGMGTNVIESMGIVKFSADTHQKIQNTFIFVVALIAAIISIIFIH